MTLRSEIKDNGFGIMKREDYVNGELVTNVLMNEKENIYTITNYEDGKKVSWAKYDNLEGEFSIKKDARECSLIKDKEIFFDESELEKSEEEMTGEERHNPDEIEYPKSLRDLLLDKKSFIAEACIPDELKSLVFKENFSEAKTGRRDKSAYDYLNDSKVIELKEQQQREQNNRASKRKKGMGLDIH